MGLARHQTICAAPLELSLGQVHLDFATGRTRCMCRRWWLPLRAIARLEMAEIRCGHRDVECSFSQQNFLKHRTRFSLTRLSQLLPALPSFVESHWAERVGGWVHGKAGKLQRKSELISGTGPLHGVQGIERICLCFYYNSLVETKPHLINIGCWFCICALGL